MFVHVGCVAAGIVEIDCEGIARLTSTNNIVNIPGMLTVAQYAMRSPMTQYILPVSEPVV